MSLRESVEKALRKVGFFRKAKKIAIRRVGAWVGRVREATADIERHEKWLRDNPNAHPARRTHHEERLRAAHTRRSRRHKRLTWWRKRLVWARNRDEFWTELLASRRRKLDAQRVDVSDFENSMTGSHEWWTLTPSAKAAVAIGVQVFGLWVSSTFRPETPGSHHGEDPTRGADLAGEWENMIAFQRWLYHNHLGAILELFGPDNRLCADNGKPYPLSEGSFLEDLHDTHDHAFITDPDYPLAYVA